MKCAFCGNDLIGFYEKRKFAIGSVEIRTGVNF